MLLLALLVAAFLFAKPTSAACSTSVNTATLALMESVEGFVPSPAVDLNGEGKPTVGFGHLCQTQGCFEVSGGFPLTKAKAVELLETDLTNPINCLHSTLSNNVKLNDNQFGALTSWTFNLGCGAMESSTLIKRLNNGEDPDTVAAAELPKFDIAEGHVQPGLVTRRAKEVALFKTPSGVAAHPC